MGAMPPPVLVRPRPFSTAAASEDCPKNSLKNEASQAEGGIQLKQVFPTASQRLLPPFKTLTELMENACDRYAQRPSLGVKQKGGSYAYTTYADLREKVAQARGLLSGPLGVQAGDMVAVISRNRAEWVWLCYGGYGVGAVNVPMYEQQKPKEWEYILNDSGSKVVVCSTDEIFAQVQELRAAGKIPKVEHVLGMDLPTGHPDSLKGQLLKCQPKPPEPTRASDLATLIYTSGTTGTPKGVMLTHSNLVSNIKACIDHTPDDTPVISPDDRSVAFLPWAHSYGQTCELHTGLALGCSTAIAAGAPGDAAELLANIQEVKPTVLFSVPTLFKKLYDGVHKKLEDEPSALTRALMRRALQVGHQVNECKARGAEPGPWLALQHRFLDQAVLSKMRAPLGGNLRVAIVAGAPTPVKVVEFVESLGVEMTEGYGLTETSPVLAVTYPDPKDRIAGTVGRAVPGTKVRLVLDGRDVKEGEEGELWVCGPQVMAGYWRKPEETAEVLVEDPVTKEVWFRTGDLVTLVGPEGGGPREHIKITGRIKEQYKLENGKYVAPSGIENAMVMSKFVDQAVLYGSGKPHNVAAVVPAFAAVAEELGLTDWYEPRALCRDERVEALLAREIPRVLTEHGVKKYEQPKAWLLVAEPFSAANQMLTPKLSIRKPNVIKAYQKQLDALYEK